MIVTTASVAGNLVFCSLAGYAFARLRFAARGVLFVVMLIVPNLVTPFGIFLLRQFFRTLPLELEEAARMDGCSRLGVLMRIVVPLSLPALATLAIVTFLWKWNDFLWPLIVINSPEHSTIQLGLTSFQGAHRPTGRCS